MIKDYLRRCANEKSRLGGVVYIVLASEQEPSEIFRGIKIALAKNFVSIQGKCTMGP